MAVDTLHDAFEEVRPSYQRLLNTIRPYLISGLEEEGIRVLSVEGRIKSIESLSEKIKKKNYTNALREVTDLCGIRVIAYLPNQLERIVAIIRDTFEIDEKNSSDKIKNLGEDRVGYGSVHLICSLGKKRARLREYRSIHDLKFEIQVRTVLQHAWAELAHGKSYKFSSRLPPELQRQLNLQAGALELIDQGLADLSDKIDKYAETTSAKKDVLLSEGINAISLQAYFDTLAVRGKRRVRSGRINVDKLVDEVRNFGIESIGELDRLVTPELRQRWNSNSNTTIYGVVRDILMFADFDKYFEKSYNKGWHAWYPDDPEFFASRHGPMIVANHVARNGIEIEEDPE